MKAFGIIFQPTIAPGIAAIDVVLGKPAAGQATSTKPLQRIVELVNKRGLITMSICCPVEELEAKLGRLTAGHDVVVLRVLDPREIDLIRRRPALSRCGIGEGSVHRSIRRQRNYLQRFAEHGDATGRLFQARDGLPAGDHRRATGSGAHRYIRQRHGGKPFNATPA